MDFSCKIGYYSLLLKMHLKVDMSTWTRVFLMFFCVVITDVFSDNEEAGPSTFTSESTSQGEKEKSPNKDASDAGPSTFTSESTDKGEKDKDEDKKGDTKKDDAKKDDDKKDDSKKAEPPKIGNFSLPTSQQPSALVGFGGNVLDEEELQIYFFADEFMGPHKRASDLIPSFLFGITNNFSIYFNFPFAPVLREDCYTSGGLEDFFIQLEYAFYNKSTVDYSDEATVVFNVTAPTGSSQRVPNTGFGSPTIFLGGTYYRTWIDWFVFTAPGAIMTSSDHGTRFGNQFLYQFGVGRSFWTSDERIYAWMIEVDGQYFQRNRIKGVIDMDSGGNIIYVTPSLWMSTKTTLIQFGFSFPVNQNYFGQQRKFHWGWDFNFAWSYY